MKAVEGLVLVFVLIIFGCSSVRSKVETEVSVERGKVCEGVPDDYGLKSTVPLEWGEHGVEFVRMGGLLCPGGAVAYITVEANVGKVNYESKGKPVNGGLDIVENFVLRCPHKVEYSIYINRYRLGAFCPPKPFKFVPEKGKKFHLEAVKFLTRRQYKKCVDFAHKSIEEAGEIDRFLYVYGLCLFNLKKFDIAKKIAEQILTINPDEPYFRLFYAEVLLYLKNRKKYEEIIDELYRSLPQTHILYYKVLCRKAYINFEDGKKSEAKEMAKEACDNGQKVCCKLLNIF